MYIHLLSQTFHEPLFYPLTVMPLPSVIQLVNLHQTLKPTSLTRVHYYDEVATYHIL